MDDIWKTLVLTLDARMHALEMTVGLIVADLPVVRRDLLLQQIEALGAGQPENEITVAFQKLREKLPRA